MSSVVSQIVNKYNLTPETDIGILSQHSVELIAKLTNWHDRGLARSRLKFLGFNQEQVYALVPQQKHGRRQAENSIKNVAQKINNLDDALFETQLLIDSEKPIATASRLSRLRSELKNSGHSSETINATKSPEITTLANRMQAEKHDIRV